MCLASDDGPPLALASPGRRPVAAQEPSLLSSDTRHGVVEPCQREASGFHGLDDSFKHPRLLIEAATADEHHVAPGGEGLDGGLGRCSRLRNGLHLEIVAGYHAREAELVLQETHDASRQRGRRVLVERGHDHVCRHHGGHARGNRRPERFELDAPQAIGRVLHDGQVVMRVGDRVAMPRKVLAACGDAFSLHGADEAGADIGYERGIGRDRTVADDGVGGIGSQVEHGRKVERDANRAQFPRERLGEPFRQHRDVGASERRHRRPDRKRRTQARHASALLIHRDPRRHLVAERFEPDRQIEHLLGTLDVASEERDATQVELAREGAHLHGERVTRNTAQEHLACASSKRHRHASHSIIIPLVTVTASTPTRVDLAGGTIDIWPLYLFHAGAQTINAALTIRTFATLSRRDDDAVVLASEDLDIVTPPLDADSLSTHTQLPLLGRLVAAFGARGLTVATRSDAPAGGGISGSSALAIAVTAGLAQWTGRTLDEEAILDVAKNVEAQVIGVPTGLQDYRPALYGGIAAIEYGPFGVRRVPLDLDADALSARLVVCYTGAPRESGINNWEITKRRIDGDPGVIAAFDAIVKATIRLRHALATGDWPSAGRAIADEWSTRKTLAPGVTTPAIDHLLDLAHEAGAWAGKVCGAGGGGCVFTLAPPERVPHVRDAWQRADARVLDCAVDPRGLQVTTS
jgi:D-glycero-alpha-D-manno-heptose-7-phosphate kinase